MSQRDHNGMVPTNNGQRTQMKDVDVEGWQHGMVDDPLGYITLRQDEPKVLTPAQVQSYDEVGFVHDERWGCCAGRVMSQEDALSVAERIKAMETRLGKSVNSFGPMHLTQKWWHEIVTAPALLDAVEDIMGPNILVWSSQFWCKEPGSTSFVGWHQDTNVSTMMIEFIQLRQFIMPAMLCSTGACARIICSRRGSRFPMSRRKRGPWSLPSGRTLSSMCTTKATRRPIFSPGVKRLPGPPRRGLKKSPRTF